MQELSFINIGAISIAVFAASVMRGLCGFGFSMMVVILISMLMKPSEIVPAVLLWEILASVVFFPSIWKDIAWKPLKDLTLGVLIGTPLGVWLLATVPPTPMVLAINFVACACCMALWRGFVLRSNLNKAGVLGTGLASGLLNGACANGGLPLILFFLSSPMAAATGRASLIAFFFFTDVWASFFAFQQNLLTLDTLIIFLWGIPALCLGLWLGHKLFGRVDEAAFKRISIMLLLLLSVTALCIESVKFFVNS